jgi:biopolymer transport protein ExbB
MVHQLVHHSGIQKSGNFSTLILISSGFAGQGERMLQTIAEYIKAGGVFMYPIIGCTMWALFLLAERTLFYFQSAFQLEHTRKTFFDLLLTKGPEASKKYLDTRQGVLKNVLCEALRDPGLSAEEVEKKMEIVLYRDLPAYRRFLGLLGVLAAVLPMLGLLGTVNGMIQIFAAVSMSGSSDPHAIAGGISVALITTQSGLASAVPMLIGNMMLSGRFRSITEKTQESCAQMLDYVRNHHA